MSEALKLMQINGQLLERAEAAEARCAQFIQIADELIVTGRAMRSDPATHELSLARLCSFMAEIAALSDTAQQETGDVE